MIFASRFKRVIAYMIDSLILSIPIAIFITIFIIAIVLQSQDAEVISLLIRQQMFTWLFVFSFLSISLYFSLFESSKYQATLGKRVLRLYVCDVDKQKLSFKKAFIRVFFWWLPALPMLVLSSVGNASSEDPLNFLELYPWIVVLCWLVTVVWYLPIFFTKDRKTCYDMLSGTRVYSRGSRCEELKKELAAQAQLIDELKEGLGRSNAS